MSKLDEFPWMEFLYCRAKCIDHMVSRGESLTKIAHTLSCDEAHVLRLVNRNKDICVVPKIFQDSV